MHSRLALPLLFFAALMLWSVAARPLLPIDETRYLSVAWEMRLSGDPVSLTRNFETYTQKPPLLFWLINLVWLGAGVSEFAARLVGPAMALLALAGTGLLARRFWPGEAGIAARAGWVLAGFTVFALYGSATMFDALLTVAVIAGIAALWRIGQGAGQGAGQGEGGGLGAWLLFGAALGIGGLAKGPVILVHLLPPLLALRLWAPAPPPAGAALKGLAAALAVGLGIVALWLVPALAAGDAGFREEILWTQSAGRVAGGLAHDRPVWFLAALLPLLLFPFGWSWRLWRGLGGALGDPAERLCLIWALSGLVIFSLVSGKQAHYLLPEFPAMALLFARALGRVRAGRGGSLAFLPVALAGALALAFGLGAFPADGDLALLAPRWPVALAGILWLGLAAVSLRLPALPAHLALGAGFGAGLHLVILLTGLSAAYDGAAIARRLALAEPGGLAQIGLPQNAEFTFVGRLRGPIATLSGPTELAAWAAANPGGTVFGPVARAGIAAPPEARLSYYAGEIGFWRAAELSVRE